MKIGLVIHSQTGNTYSVAQSLQERLLKAGHSVTLEKLITENDKETKPEKIKLMSKPNIDNYDILIFGCPVWGFSLSAVMKLYLSQISTIESKTVLCFVTHYFPFACMGGKGAIKQIEQLCESKGSKVTETGIINWSSSKRAKTIEDMITKFTSRCN